MNTKWNNLQNPVSPKYRPYQSNISTGFNLERPSSDIYRIMNKSDGDEFPLSFPAVAGTHRPDDLKHDIVEVMSDSRDIGTAKMKTITSR